MTRKDKAERQEAIDRLREEIHPGDKIYTILRHRSRSGMQRSISLIQIDSEGTAREWDYLAARAMGDRIDNVHGGIKVGGCGMDMGFSLVYSLGRTLFPEGFGCVGEKCRSNDHSNGDWDRTPHASRENCKDLECDCHGKDGKQLPLAVWCSKCGCSPGLAHWHRDGGYALVQVWL